MSEGRVISHASVGVVLRSWPFEEADLIVSLLTREQGRVKGVARHAMRSRRRFGGALEPMTVVLARYTERPKQDLVRLDAFEIIASPLSDAIDWERMAGLQLLSEVIEEALPELAAEDAVFRLTIAVLGEMQVGQVVLPAAYFCLWMARLMGWMPALGHCAVCGLDLRGGAVWWSPTADGLTCEDDLRRDSVRLGAEEVDAVRFVLREGIGGAVAAERVRAVAPAMLRFGVGLLERHLQRRLRSATVLHGVTS